MNDMNVNMYYLLGNPVNHSYSPQIYNYLFNYYKINSSYSTIQVERETFEDAIKNLKIRGVSGLNITAPYKEQVLGFVDKFCGISKLAGSVNTIKNINGSFYGYNTDFYGSIKAFEYEGIVVKDKKVLIFGAGGVARTLFLVLQGLGAREIVILNRTLEKAKNISKIHIKKRILVKCGELNNICMENELPNTDLIINATSSDIILDNDLNIEFNKVKQYTSFFDVIYNPIATKLLRDAQDNGFKTANGLSMLIFQALKAFEIWTGIKNEILFREIILNINRNQQFLR